MRLLLQEEPIQRTLQTLAARIADKRSYRFSLAALLIAILLIAVGLAWYGSRLRRIASEQFRLEGNWQVLDDNGMPVAISGKPVIVEIAPGSYSIDPLRDPKWLDFHTPQGTNRAIYRWEGRRLRIRQVSEGLERPKSFDDRIEDIGLKPGRGSSTQSMNTYLLERLPD